MSTTFQYRAVDQAGKVVTGEVQAEHRADVLADLRKQGCTLLHLEELGQAPVVATSKASGFSFEPFGITSETVAFFTRNLAELTDAGLPIMQSMEALQTLTPSLKFRQVIDTISRDILSGQGLHEAFCKHPRVFSPLYLSMLKVAEASGDLSQLLNRLANYLDFELELRGKIKAALAYPIFILGFALLLVWGMVSFLLPGFVPIWEHSKLNLNDYPITLVLMKMSDVSRSPVNAALLLLLLGAVMWGLRRLLEMPETQRARDSFLYRMPGLRGLVQLSLMTRLTQALATLLRVGVPLVPSIRLVGETAGNQVISRALVQVADNVEKGLDLGRSFSEVQVFPPLAVQMVSIAERAGNLPETFERLGRYYQQQMDTTIRAFTALIEPLTMIVIGGIVFVFVLGVFLPIMGVVGAMQSHM